MMEESEKSAKVVGYIITKGRPTGPDIRIQELADEWNGYLFSAVTPALLRAMDITLNEIKEIIKSHPELEHTISLKIYEYMIPD